MDLLPDDVLADVLDGLTPCSLAACRSVCKAWRAVIDAHCLLRKDLLPLTMAGIYVVYDFVHGGTPTFFSRPSIGVGDKTIQGNLGYLNAIRDGWSHIRDHCNGLILLDEGVVNPATRQWARLPPYPARVWIEGGFYQDEFLAFDPMVSPHFDVLLVHCVLDRYPDPTKLDSSGWPPSPFVTSAFSSKTWRWEERSFVREGMAVRSVAEVEPFLPNVYHNDAVYWRGRLYVYQIYFIIRLSLEENKYRVIRLPPMNEACGGIEPHLGKSKKGVYYGFVHGWCKLQMWFLNESNIDTEWNLEREVDLTPSLANFPWRHGDGSWSVQGVNHETPEKEGPEWDSDNEDGTVATTATEVSVPKEFRGDIYILGFHPYKEIVFLHTWSTRVMAYHLNSSMLEDLGCLPLDGDDEIWSSWAYTPCWMENCVSANNFEANIER
ncbi:unnamed protein product [Alopecurus aequalis]